MSLKKALLAVLPLVALASCGEALPDVEPGISRTLAYQRKATISNPEYTLQFDIPSEKSESIRGRETISFISSGKNALVLDFRTDAVDSVIVDGKALERGSQWDWRDEHVVVSRKFIRKGQNSVELVFTPEDQSFNRNDEYLYTLVVPERSRTIYPCFDQPDMKACFSLSLNVPEGWVSVSSARKTSETTSAGRTTASFEKTLPVSTYLFSFVTGKWQSRTLEKDGVAYTAYYRETDPAKVAQLDDILSEVTSSVKWMEDYTGIPLPWPKYDFIIIPGFQYGGMEHVGAIQYNESTIFLGKNPTADERYKRIELIAHETSHMWFGDLVTMAWFDDVWTKEVYANYFAAQIARPLFPQINHQLNWLKSLTAPAMSEDRTLGTTSIQQTLPNLNSAGLVYNNIVYDKAPVMMDKLVALMGEEAFHEGMVEYLNRYKYSNATWDDLVGILDSRTDKDIRKFSDVWVHEKGMPDLRFERRPGDILAVVQSDPLGRGLLWPQSFQVTLYPSMKTLDVTMDDALAEWTVKVDGLDSQIIVPGTDGKAYGRVLPSGKDLEWIVDNWNTSSDPVVRQSLLMTVWENYLAGNIPAEKFLQDIIDDLSVEKDELTASTIVGYLGTVLSDLSSKGIDTEYHQRHLYYMSSTHPLASCRLQVLRSLFSSSDSDLVVDALYDIWDRESVKELGDADYMTLSYELAIRMPQRRDEIISRQRSRIDGSDPGRQFNADRLRQFDFISRATVPSGEKLDEVFSTLLTPEGRRMEPWSQSVIRLLMHRSREEYSVKYIKPALEALQDVQRTGDIFFPGNWCKALLSECRSAGAKQAVDEFLNAHPDYPELLRNKILLASYNLDRNQNR